MRRILIIRLSAIGDVVMATPLIRRLADHYPDAGVSWLVQEEAAELLTGHPCLEEVIVWPRGRWRRLRREGRWFQFFREFRDLRGRLRRRRFDVVLDIQGLLKSGLWAWMSGARHRVGLGSREGSGLLMTRRIPRPRGDPRIGSEYRLMLERLGVPPEPFAMELHLTGEERRRGRLLAGEGSGYVALLPFTTRPQKHWVEARWPVLAAQLRERLGLRSVILGGPADRAAAVRIASAASTRMLPLAGETSLREAAAVIEGARLVVGVDTGLTHMGIALGRPTLALFGSTRPYLETGRSDARVLYHPRDCSPCRRKPVCDGRFDCMAEITVEEVVEAAGRLLESR